MKSTEKPLLLMFGDSLIDYGEWPRRMRSYQVVSSGVPGERTEELQHRIDTLSPRISGADIPAAIIIMSGTNDIVFGDLRFVEVLRQIITALQQRYPDAQILLTSLLPYRLPGLSDAVHTVNKQMQEICAETGCSYFDLCGEFEKSYERLFDYDGVHLSNQGYRLWASSLDEFLANLLAKEDD
ncbi:MAG: GDSL-type esterase/lipase family protein [Desulfofustis sp.]